jgi:DTW domain-containing protein YfiP
MSSILTAPTVPETAPAPVRACCADCGRAPAACQCSWRQDIPNEVEVLVLQHPLEQGHAKGSLWLLASSLRRCRWHCGEQFEPDQLSAWLRGASAVDAPGDGRRAVLLYPGDGAAPGAAMAASASLCDPAGWRLVVLDGTWRKSRKLLHLNPALGVLPRLSLDDPPASRYVIRRAHAPHQRSTLEAVCLALQGLESAPGRYAPLLEAFSASIIAQRSGWRTRA